MGVRKDVKEAILQRFVDEWLDGVPYILPKNPDESVLGATEWARITLQHTASRQITVSRLGSRRYARTMNIFVQVMTEVDKGDEREDVFADVLMAMFEGRAFTGISGIVRDAVARETGKDKDGRYNVLLFEAVLEYRLSK